MDEFLSPNSTTFLLKGVIDRICWGFGACGAVVELCIDCGNQPWSG
jgi:hypothetical protein